jgi:hypothetical protein
MRKRILIKLKEVLIDNLKEGTVNKKDSFKKKKGLEFEQ